MATLTPTLATVEMGYGHLRAACALAERFGVPVRRADRAPLADSNEILLWHATRIGYERLSRLSQHRMIGAPFAKLLQRLTSLDGSRSPATAHRADAAARFLARRIEHGFGAGLCRHLEDDGGPLVTTFYASALAADRRTSVDIHCVVTDIDVHRVWVPPDASTTRIRYLVPGTTTRDRLETYGVPSDRITVTGFPLPLDLERRARELLEWRLARLRGNTAKPPLVTFAVGGAGAQARRARGLLVDLAGPLRQGSVRLALVAGLRKNLARKFRRWAAEIGLQRGSGAVSIVEADSFEELYRTFNSTLEQTDVLWTKPSELSFYAALGLPLILDDPVGDHERANARWVRDVGAGVNRPGGQDFGSLVTSWLRDGTLAACAENGFARLRRGGAAAIAKIVFKGS
jgi:hypothetical protein